MTDNPNRLGGVIHTYQKYDPLKFPSPTTPPPDLVTPAFEHMLEHGSLDGLTDEELANAVEIDPSQIMNLGPSLGALQAMLEERKRKILETYETRQAQKEAAKTFGDRAARANPPAKAKKAFDKAVKGEQLYELENLYYQAGGDGTPFARDIVQLVDKLGEKYQVDELAGKYDFTGRQGDGRAQGAGD